MEKIAITGGKGGTGKSTVAVILANKLAQQGKKVLLVDCDVECPNDYLLTGSKLGNVVQKVQAPYPKLIEEKCTKCGICVDACRENAIFQKPGEYPQFLHNLCSSCGACWEICPFGAIQKEYKEIGKIHLNSNIKYQITKNKKDSEDLYLVTGEAKANLEETGPVVKETLEYAEDLAEKKNIDIMLIDTAAGTHCPVINALLKAERAFVVTEPTPMGAYDLELILDLADKLGLPSEVILNQANLGDKKQIETVIEKYKSKITKEIPYSKQISNAYSKGELLQLNPSLISQ